MNLDRDTYPQNPVLMAISAGRRRVVLDSLLDSVSPISEQDLAIRIAPPDQGAPIADGTAETQSIQTDLTHNHLPTLETAGLIDWDQDNKTVEASSHPALDDPRFRQLLQTEIDGLDAVLSDLSHEYRRIVLTVLKDAPMSVTRTDLAKEIVRRRPRLAHRDSAALDEVIISLHHIHLPTLADTNLIEYDSDAGRATYTGHSAVDTVFGIIFEPEGCIADKLDGFLEGLHDSYRQASQDVNESFDWPHFWREPHRG